MKWYEKHWAETTKELRKPATKGDVLKAYFWLGLWIAFGAPLFILKLIQIMIQ